MPSSLRVGDRRLSGSALAGGLGKNLAKLALTIYLRVPVPAEAVAT